MGRRLAMVAVEGNYLSPWIFALGQEKEVKVSGPSDMDMLMILESHGSEETHIPLLTGAQPLPCDMRGCFRYRFSKQTRGVDAPTTVEVIY